MFRLCYIDNDNAYFTTKELSLQWGDDWDDAPYEHNAGTPYEPAVHYYIDGTTKKYEKDWNEDGTPKWEIYKLKFESNWNLQRPCAQYSNSPFSVQDINTGIVPWLAGTDVNRHPIAIYAGVSIDEFKSMVKKAGGKIYVEEP
jgi:hypothetical protein